MVKNKKSKKRLNNNKKYRTKKKYFQKGKGSTKLCFIITCYIPNNLKVYIDYSINKINELYPNSTIILVDNNSENKDYFNQFKEINNIILLENSSEQKYEIGAYNCAIDYIIKNNLTFDYYILLQDSVFPNKKYDFNLLNGIQCSIIYRIGESSMWFGNEELKNKCKDILKTMNVDNINYDGCRDSSFISNHETLKKINMLTRNVIVKDKSDSIACERWLGILIQALNNNNPILIDGYIADEKYDVRDVNISKAQNIDHFFIKKSLGRI